MLKSTQLVSDRTREDMLGTFIYFCSPPQEGLIGFRKKSAFHSWCSQHVMLFC